MSLLAGTQGLGITTSHDGRWPWCRGRTPGTKLTKEFPFAGDGGIEKAGSVMAPGWLTVAAWVYLATGFCCAGVIGYDIAVNGRRQPMGVFAIF